MAKAEKCPECGGPPKGRGYTHVEGCSKASAKGGTAGSQKRVKAGVPSIDGRTRIADLLKWQARIEEVLAEKDKADVAKVKKAMANVDRLKAELADAEALIN